MSFRSPIITEKRMIKTAVVHAAAFLVFIAIGAIHEAVRAPVPSMIAVAYFATMPAVAGCAVAWAMLTERI